MNQTGRDQRSNRMQQECKVSAAPALLLAAACAILVLVVTVGALVH